MVIEIHGFPGAGKTTVLTMIAQKLLQGKSILGLVPRDKVYTSFPCPGCLKINPKEIGKVDFSDATIIIDEISEFFDNRQYKSFDSDTMMYMKLSRHYKNDIVIASQSATDADKKIRSLVSTTYIIDKFFCFTAIKPIYKSHALVNGEPGERFEVAPVAAWKWCYRPKYYKYFDSYETKPLPIPEPEYWECNFEIQKCTKKRVKRGFLL